MRWIGFALIIALLFGCASHTKAIIESQDPKAIMSRGMVLLSQKRYSDSVAYFRKLTNEFPLTSYAQHAYLELAYVYYEIKTYDLVEVYAKRYQQLYPDAINLDYAIYLEAMASYQSDRTFFEAYAYTDLSQRDIGSAEKAFYTFGKLIERYPDSDYAYDAYKRMIYIRNRVAKMHLQIAKFYARKQLYGACILRVGYLLENFISSPYVADGMNLLRVCYEQIGVKDHLMEYSKWFDGGMDQMSKDSVSSLLEE